MSYGYIWYTHRKSWMGGRLPRPPFFLTRQRNKRTGVHVTDRLNEAAVFDTPYQAIQWKEGMDVCNETWVLGTVYDMLLEMVE